MEHFKLKIECLMVRGYWEYVYFCSFMATLQVGPQQLAIPVLHKLIQW